MSNGMRRKIAAGRRRGDRAPEALEPRLLFAFTAHVNFQPLRAAVPAGYVADTGAVYADRGNGLIYGWSAANSFGADRNSALSADQRYDTLNYLPSPSQNISWDIAVPNGQYQVHVVAGDASFFGNIAKIDVENVLTVDATTTSGSRWTEATKTVTVSDGELTIRAAAGASNAKVNYVDVTQLTPTPTPTPTPTTFAAHVNFQPAAAAVPAGYVADSGATYANRGNGYTYGWTSTNNFGADRNSAASPDQRYDTLNYLPAPNLKNAWEIAVPNGTYEVHLVAGDALYVGNVAKIDVEGVRIIDGTTSAGTKWIEGTRTITVSDGKLTILAAAGASSAKVDYIDVTQVTPTPTPTPTPTGVSSLTLINTATSKDIGTMFNGQTLDLSSVGSKLNIRANVGASVKSVVFKLDGITVHTESSLPLALFGDTAAGYSPWTPSLGAHTLSVIPYSGIGATGTPGTALTLNFTITRSAPTSTVKSPLGGNLNFQGDRVEDHPFTDLVKTTLGFYNLAGRVASNGVVDLAKTDANGWPTEDFGFAAIDNSEFGSTAKAGVYHMSYTGPASAAPTLRRNAPGGAATVPANAALPTLTFVSYNAATGEHRYDVSVPAGVVTVAFDFHNTGSAVKNIKLLQPGYSLSDYPVFANEYVNLLKSLSPNVLRLMDFTHTSNNPVADWSQRTQATDATQTRVALPGDLQPSKGIAWEYAIDLAKQVGASVWVNVPIRATDNYVTQLATLLKSRLNANQLIYVEYSNEVWNTAYEQTGYNRAAAGAEVVAAVKAGKQSDLNYDHLAVDTSKADGGANATVWGERRYARRTKQISDLFKAVWTSAGLASPINTRVRVILASQIAVQSRFSNELKYLTSVQGAPKNYLYGIGVAPYIGLGQYASSTNATPAQLLEGMHKSIDNYQAATGANSLDSAFALANTYGLKLVAYEGGIDTYGANNIANKAAAVQDPRIADVVSRYLDLWYSRGGGQINWVTLGARSYNTPYGSWSITNDILNYGKPKELGFGAARDAGFIA